MAERLEALGLGDGGLVLIVSLLSQTIHVAPFELAAGWSGRATPRPTPPRSTPSARHR